MAKNMVVDDIIAERKSVRTYLDKPIARADIERCIEAARLAPSAHNVQPWRFVVVDDAELKKDFCREVCGGVFKSTRFIENAPAIVVIVAKIDLVVNRVARAVQGSQYYLLDIGIAGEHLVLKAQEMGIGTCWIGWFNGRKATKFFRLPAGHRVVALIAMGYPAEGATRDKADLPMESILRYNGWEKR